MGKHPLSFRKSPATCLGRPGYPSRTRKWSEEPPGKSTEGDGRVKTVILLFESDCPQTNRRKKMLARDVSVKEIIRKPEALEGTEVEGCLRAQRIYSRVLKRFGLI